MYSLSEINGIRRQLNATGQAYDRPSLTKDTQPISTRIERRRNTTKGRGAGPGARRADRGEAVMAQRGRPCTVPHGGRCPPSPSTATRDVV